MFVQKVMQQLQNLTVTPWSKAGTTLEKQSAPRRKYITRAKIDQYGKSKNCRACNGQSLILDSGEPDSGASSTRSKNSNQRYRDHYLLSRPRSRP